MSDPDIEIDDPSFDGLEDGKSRNVSNGQPLTVKEENPSLPTDTNKANSSDASIHGSEKPDNRPRHPRTGKPLSLPRETAVVTVVCLAQLMTQAGVGQGIEFSISPIVNVA